MACLVIVESPAKAKTIQKLLSLIDPSRRFTVLASFGHVCDMPKDRIGVDPRTLAVEYLTSPGKHKMLKQIREAARVCDVIYLASDADREGESIAWHLSRELRVHKNKLQRITFQEITRSALEAALRAPRQVDMPLVMAQQGRRVLDRIVGYRVSPMLWRAPEFRGQRGLSAGRVQSATLKLITDIDVERENYQSHSVGWRVHASFKESELHTIYQGEPSLLISKEEATLFFTNTPNTWTVTSVENHTTKEHPAKPFTTSTLQQAAVKALGWPTKDTMRVAQTLYEQGKITYMRTDSTSISQDAIKSIMTYITRQFGANFCHPGRAQTYAAKQGAHEAIRPTQFRDLAAEKLEGKEAVLYSFIFNHTIQALMAPAEFADTDVVVNTTYAGTVRSLIFPGYLRLTLKEQPLKQAQAPAPTLKEGQELQLAELLAKQEYQHPARPFTEATLVKAMEAKGIGRPSTYVSTLDKLFEREYVIRQNVTVFEGTKVHDFVMNLKTKALKEKLRKLESIQVKHAVVSTELGRKVTAFLQRDLGRMVDSAYTAHMETLLDQIATGQRSYEEVVRVLCNELRLQI